MQIPSDFFPWYCSATDIADQAMTVGCAPKELTFGIEDAGNCGIPQHGAELAFLLWLPGEDSGAMIGLPVVA
jgi:hypothetical protein